MWVMANGCAPTITPTSNPLVFIVGLVLLPIWSAFHFYWVHRLLHHRYYKCTYGNQEMPWDRWFGTFHDGSEDSTATTRARKKEMHAKG